MLKSTEVVGACWLLVGCLLAACSEVLVWEILNCDRTHSTVFPLVYVLYFEEFLINDSCGFMI